MIRKSLSIERALWQALKIGVYIGRGKIRMIEARQLIDKLGQNVLHGAPWREAA